VSAFVGAGLIGMAAGFFSGLFGIGGGLVMVPAMVLLLGIGQHRAHATSMAAIIVVAAAAVIPFATDGAVEWTKAGWLLTGSLAGAVVGARVISRVSAVWLARAFVLLALVAAGRLGLAS
jgi:uncharacterized protein